MEFIPVLNPDGYEWTRTVDNLWRKSRKPNNGFPACPGTDLNRKCVSFSLSLSLSLSLCLSLSAV